MGEIIVYKIFGKDLKDYMEWVVGYFNLFCVGDVIVSFDKICCVFKYSMNDFFGGVKYEIDLIKLYGSRIINLCFICINKLIKMSDVMMLGMNVYRMEVF